MDLYTLEFVAQLYKENEKKIEEAQEYVTLNSIIAASDRTDPDAHQCVINRLDKLEKWADVTQTLTEDLERLMDIIPTNLREFKRQIRSYDDLREAAKSSPEDRKRLMDIILTNPCEFKRLISSNFDLRRTGELFPEDHERLIDYILNDTIEFDRLIAYNFQLRETEKSFPEYAFIFDKASVSEARSAAEEYTSKNRRSARLSSSHPLLRNLSAAEEPEGMNTTVTGHNLSRSTLIDNAHLASTSEGDESDDDFVTHKVKKSWTREQRNDRNFVLSEVCKDWEALRFASSTLRDDYEIIIEALKQSKWAIHLTSHEVIFIFCCR